MGICTTNRRQGGRGSGRIEGRKDRLRVSLKGRGEIRWEEAGMWRRGRWWTWREDDRTSGVGVTKYGNDFGK